MLGVMERMLPLRGGRNFRDLGGYRTEDGRRVRWRRMFRSGVMSYLTEEDREQIAQLGIRASCDFRDAGERQREPTSWHDPGIVCMTWERTSGDLGLIKLLAGKELTPELTRTTMLAYYRRLPYRFERQYGDMLRALAEGHVPLVINCAAGKDRTGMAAAVILASLGVSREQIIEDYALTDRAVDLEKELFEHPEGSLGFDAEMEFLAKVPRETRAPMLQAHPEYLETAFAQIERNEGSLQGYLRQRLGLTGEMQERLRETLLET